MSARKKIQIKDKMRKLYCYQKTNLDLWNSIVGCASKSNIDIIKRCQNVALRAIIAAYRFERNDVIHRDMMLPTVVDEIQKFDHKHETRLDHHVNPLAVQLLDISK
ncbi:Hypothetical protein CINCED_3A015451 [Cinara cedri]|uniref:Uncharacterized protein n=1 Tax=Cinara cedri TaxID=506608 RepID=A0A5E4MRK0_9HEMI|nr:Hypothetical protein CINCED_3A015451 [Cinara cedri]